MGFLSHNIKTWVKFIREHYNRWIIFLQQYFYKRLLIPQLLRHPTAFILYPCTFFLILSYPALYNLYSSPSLIFGNSFLESDFIKSVTIEELQPFKLDNSNYNQFQSLADSDFVFKTFWLQPSLESDFTYSPTSKQSKKYANALNKTFLVESLHLQNSLLEGIDVYPFDSIFLHSPFQFWSNNVSILNDDKFVLKTIQENEYLKSAAGVPMNNLDLIVGTVRVDGIIRSASSLRFTIFYPSSRAEEIDNKLSENLQNLDTSSFIIAQEKSDEFNNRYSKFKVIFKTCNILEKIIILICPIFSFIYLLIALTNVHMVKSRAGLLMAYIVETFLAVSSSCTITSYLYRNLDLLQIPSQVVLCVVLFIGIENMFRLAVSVSKMSDDW
ncbi:unnamed protein product [Ambrosiozyma monospora]|uniref:Unnamed protein product n=1 Tax=Ambrosiozyma monospora TaxID=43982 RepID=A0ACB5TP59_AMBMO|nr:unnamed protein product [Ambrosiozyma monospora]